MHPVLRMLGRNVRRLRLVKELMQSQLAKKAKLSPYVLDRIETGESNPSISVVFRLARALGVTPADLLIGAPPRGPRPRN